MVAVLRALAATDCGARRPVIVPRVLGYDAPSRLLLLAYESGQSVIAAMTQLDGVVPATIGRALATLHAAPVVLDATTSPAAQLATLRRQVGEFLTETAVPSIHRDGV